MIRRYRGAAAALLLAWLSFPVAAVDPATRQIMHDVFGSLSHLLAFTLDAERFARSADRQPAQRKLEVLRGAAEALQAHASVSDIGFELLSGSFVASVNEYSHFFNAKRQQEAQFFLIDMIQNCVACHSRLPKARDFPLGQRLFDHLDLDSFSLQEQAQLQVAARRFEDALGTWERLFRDPEVDPVDLDVEGNVLDYLVTAVRVSDNLERPRKALERLIARPDCPFFMRHHLRAWADDLKALAPQLRGPVTLEKAQKLFDLASVKTLYPGSREQTVHDLVASALLYRYLESRSRGTGDDLARAYYMLGVIEARSFERAWAAPKVELQFEAAARSAPSGPLARKSYALVEEYAVEGYGSPEMFRRLQALRKLLGITPDQKERSRLQWSEP